jgi:hypothetical protein
MYVDPEGKHAVLVGAITMAATALVASIWAELANAPGPGDKIEPPAPLAPYAAGAITGISLSGGISAGLFCAAGREIKIGKNIRIAPGGNRTNHELGRYPHYHRRVDSKVPGHGKEGQGMNRHRPWETKSNDTSFWDRF